MRHSVLAVLMISMITLSSDSYAQWNTSSPPNIFYHVTGGKVGIGTGTPRATLDLGTSGGAMLVLNPGTTPGVNYTGHFHNDLIFGSWLTDGLSNAFISTGYIQDPKRKFHIGSASSDVFASASFVPHFTVTAGGNVGIGTTSPQSKLHIGGDNLVIVGNYTSSTGTKGILFPGWRDTAPDYFGASIEAAPSWACCSGYPSGGYAGVKNVDLNFNIHDPGNWDPNARLTVMKISSNGNVGIGSANPDQKLTVNGVIHTKEVLVDMNVPGPDYVFEKDYDLLPLAELEAYISQNKHLPEIPSAKEMEANGLKLMEMNLLLLKKVEELTLHMIQLKKDQAAQEKEMKAEIADLKKQLMNK